MTEEQPIEIVSAAELVEKVRAKKELGCRLVQIGATHLKEKIEINYSFDLKSSYSILRVEAPVVEPKVPSVSAVFWCAFIYENEMHDLFGITVENMVLDFKGKFYQTAVAKPFAPKPAPAPAAAAPVASTAAKS